MDSLVDRWKNVLQTEMKYSQLESSKREEDSRRKQREVVVTDVNEPGKGSLHKEGKDRDGRNRSTDGKKNSSAKESRQTEGKKVETPNKKGGRRQEKLIENCANAILEVTEPSQPDRVRSKIKSLLQDLLLNGALQRNEMQKSSHMKDSVVSMRYSERGYAQLEARYFESEKDRQYLRGKMEMSAKRNDNLERQLERYSKMEKLLDSSIVREADMRQELARVQVEKDELRKMLADQEAGFSREVQSIRELIDSLKAYLPAN